MTDAEIEELAQKHGLDLGMRHPLQMVMYNGMIRFEAPRELTYYGVRLLAFARELLKRNAK